MTSRGILGWGAYLPARRLDRSAIASVAGGGGGTGTRTVASYDEDATTMGVAAARLALRGRLAAAVGAGTEAGTGTQAGAGPEASAGTGAGSGAVPALRTLWFATAEPPYLDKTNATAVHAALRLDPAVAAYDAVGSVRSALGALRAAHESNGPALVVTAGLRTGLAGGPDEASGGDAAAALLVGTGEHGPVLAELLAWASLSEEFLDRWRIPGDPASRRWEERFGEGRYTALGAEALDAALAQAGIAPASVTALVVAGSAGPRAARAIAAKAGIPPERLASQLEERVGNPGAAQAALLLAATLEALSDGEETIVVLLHLSDGADAAVFRTSGALAGYRPARPVADQLDQGLPVSYGTYLRWRGLLHTEPARRPAPSRTSAPAARRALDFKFGLVGSVAPDGTVHLPPSPLDDGPRPMAEAAGTIAAFTVDRLAYSPSPPVIFAVVDFDGGGRLPAELTDADEADIAVGQRVEMTFRRLFTADGIHNYFWKAKPVR